MKRLGAMNCCILNERKNDGQFVKDYLFPQR